jgi:hypothetical protein
MGVRAVATITASVIDDLLGALPVLEVWVLSDVTPE